LASFSSWVDTQLASCSEENLRVTDLCYSPTNTKGFLPSLEASQWVITYFRLKSETITRKLWASSSLSRSNACSWFGKVS